MEMKICRMHSTSETGISRRTPLTLWTISEISAVAERPRWTRIGWFIGFRRTRRTHKPIIIEESELKSYIIHKSLITTECDNKFTVSSMEKFSLNLRRSLTLAYSPHPGLSELPGCRPSLHSTPCNQPAHPDPPQGWRSLVDRAQGHSSPQGNKIQTGTWDSPSHLEETVPVQRCCCHSEIYI